MYQKCSRCPGCQERNEIPEPALTQTEAASHPHDNIHIRIAPSCFHTSTRRHTKGISAAGIQKCTRFLKHTSLQGPQCVHRGVLCPRTLLQRNWTSEQLWQISTPSHFHHTLTSLSFLLLMPVVVSFSCHKQDSCNTFNTWDSVWVFKKMFKNHQSPNLSRFSKRNQI